MFWFTTRLPLGLRVGGLRASVSFLAIYWSQQCPQCQHLTILAYNQQKNSQRVVNILSYAIILPCRVNNVCNWKLCAKAWCEWSGCQHHDRNIYEYSLGKMDTRAPISTQVREASIWHISVIGIASIFAKIPAVRASHFVMFFPDTAIGGPRVPPRSLRSRAVFPQKKNIVLVECRSGSRGLRIITTDRLSFSLWTRCQSASVIDRL